MLQSSTQWKHLLRGGNWTPRALQSRCDLSFYKLIPAPLPSRPECLLRASPLPSNVQQLHPETIRQLVFSKDSFGALHTPFSFQYQQMRWKGRNDGNRYFAQPRKPTKKQRKKYHRLLQKQQMERDKHGKPGSKAGIRRQWEQHQKQEFLESARNPSSTPELPPSEENASYGWDDALLDDVIGNVNQATPTPQPAYLGHKHRFYYNAVVDQMDDYFQSVNANGTATESSALTPTDPLHSSSTSAVVAAAADLPTDEMISKALRAFRDKNGTRHKNPVGIIPALQHVLYDMQVPLHALGEYTYSTLLTCCRSPSEGRRVLQLIREQGHDVSSYCWTILCDLYAKAADVQGCVQVQQEMLHHGVSPTLPSYTSLIAACYRVAINGRLPHPVRAEASKIGWDKWQEMRIIGIEADAMAYGAILRLKAATGKAEDCINVLQEMERFSVHPTTLCFASALRGVARSHAIAIRYERGASPRHRRRETIALHHGKLARKIVILAEAAGIEPDDGYISALCLCAGAAGDLATVKAIYIASEIIKSQKDLRRIGSDAHLARLRGESVVEEEDALRMFENPRTMSSRVPSVWDEELTNALMEDSLGGDSMVQASNFIANGSSWMAPSSSDVSSQRKRYIPSFGEREYGKDNRVLSSILHACAQAVDSSGMGTIWQGRENNGYLCLNSLRLIAQPKLPEYSDNSIPGQTMTDNLRLKNEHRQDYREGKRESRKFEGIEIDEKAGSTLDDLMGDPEYAKRYVTPDGRRRPEYRKTTPDEIWRMKYGDDWDKELQKEDPKETPGTNDVKSIESSGVASHSDSASVDTTNAPVAKKNNVPSPDMFFDYDTMRWKPRSDQSSFTSSVTSAPRVNPVEDNTKKDADAATPVEQKEKMYFDSDAMRWKTLPRTDETKAASSSTDDDDEEDDLSDLEDLDDGDDDGSDLDSGDEEDLPTEWKMEDFEELKEALNASDLEGDDGEDEEDDLSDWDVEEDEDDDELSSDWEVEDLDDDKLDEAVSSAAAKSDSLEVATSQNYRFDKGKEQWIPISADETETDSDGAKISDDYNAPDVEKREYRSSSQPVLTEFESKIASGKLKSPAVESSAATGKPSKKKESNPKKKMIDNEEAFAVFFSDLQKESVESGQGEVLEEEARELFEMMKDEYNEFIGMTPEELGLEKHPDVPPQNAIAESTDDLSDEHDASQYFPTTPSNDDSITAEKVATRLSEQFPNGIESDVEETLPELFASAESVSYSNSLSVEKFGTDAVFSAQTAGVSAQTVTFDPMNSSVEDDYFQEKEASRSDFVEESNNLTSLSNIDESYVDKYSADEGDSQDYEVFHTEKPKHDYTLERLRQLLPTFSDKRLKNIVRAYDKSLSDPSMLDLVPIVRENMPDYITSTWLKQMSWLTADFVIQRAAQDDAVNTEILNAVLELQTSAGSLDRAIEFHQTEFERHNLVPTQYSDRLVIQMLLRNNRFNRALSFKQIIENTGRSLDLRSFGSLIEHCSRRQQLGSAMLLLKECLSVHGAPPSEASLTNLRHLCRHAGIEEEIGLESMIGKDPIEWLRQGELDYKRENSKKGRRDVQLARNIAVRI